MQANNDKSKQSLLEQIKAILASRMPAKAARQASLFSDVCLIEWPECATEVILYKYKQVSTIQEEIVVPLLAQKQINSVAPNAKIWQVEISQDFEDIDAREVDFSSLEIINSNSE